MFACGLDIIRTTFPFYFIYVFLEILGATVRGTGNAAAPMMAVLLNICILRTALLFLFPVFYTSAQGVATTYPLTWFTTSAVMALLYFRTLRNSQMNDCAS